MAAFWIWAIIPAALLVVAYIMLVATDSDEKARIVSGSVNDLPKALRSKKS